MFISDRLALVLVILLHYFTKTVSSENYYGLIGHDYRIPCHPQQETEAAESYRWNVHGNIQAHHRWAKYKINKATITDSGLYECRAVDVSGDFKTQAVYQHEVKFLEIKDKHRVDLELAVSDCEESADEKVADINNLFCPNGLDHCQFKVNRRHCEQEKHELASEEEQHEPNFEPIKKERTKNIPTEPKSDAKATIYNRPSSSTKNLISIPATTETVEKEYKRDARSEGYVLQCNIVFTLPSSYNPPLCDNTICLVNAIDSYLSRQYNKIKDNAEFQSFSNSEDFPEQFTVHKTSVNDTCRPGYQIIDHVDINFCMACKPGTFSNNGICVECVEGTYQNHYGQRSCKVCEGEVNSQSTHCAGSDTTSGQSQHRLQSGIKDVLEDELPIDENGFSTVRTVNNEGQTAAMVDQLTTVGEDDVEFENGVILSKDDPVLQHSTSQATPTHGRVILALIICMAGLVWCAHI